MIRNVATYNELEQKLIAANNRSVETENLINAFLSNVSHEIRTPLNSILGFSELLKEPDLSEDERDEYFGYIDNKCNYLLGFVDNIIDLARIESRELQVRSSKTNINQLLNDLYGNFQSELKRFKKEHIKLMLNTKSLVNDLIVNTDEKRLRQVLSSLLNNAVKFTNKGYIDFGYNLKNLSTLEFYVRDTGIGIPDDKREVIFEKFKVVNVALSKKIGGAGLGLTLSKNLVKLLGGEIWLESSEEEGTTFYFTIPINKSESDVLVPNYERLSYNWQDKTMLVAEDIEMNYMFIEAALKKTRIKLLWAKDGEEAIEICRSRATSESKIDLILMDIQMPLFDGYEATKRIKEFFDVPIISHTAYDYEEEAQKSIEAGCDDYLPKPVAPNVLIQKLQQYFNANNF